MNSAYFFRAVAAFCVAFLYVGCTEPAKQDRVKQDDGSIAVEIQEPAEKLREIICHLLKAEWKWALKRDEYSLTAPWIGEGTIEAESAATGHGLKIEYKSTADFSTRLVVHKNEQTPEHVREELIGRAEVYAKKKERIDKDFAAKLKAVEDEGSKSLDFATDPKVLCEIIKIMQKQGKWRARNWETGAVTDVKGIMELDAPNGGCIKVVFQKTGAGGTHVLFHKAADTPEEVRKELMDAIVEGATRLRESSKKGRRER